ncbi:MAG TPA: type II toxin-antitoxin system RelE/ParE family toxin, partial [Actinomycetota bacterium]|nr:type II toxin-antitoxin system RelE/ParE family toxin [Actinomycetota bacterium]
MRLSTSAQRAYESLDQPLRQRIKNALLDLAAKVEGGERGGKSVKTIQGSADSLHRLRVGNHRVMYDLLDPERVLLVLGIVDRKDLETWL